MAVERLCSDDIENFSVPSRFKVLEGRLGEFMGDEVVGLQEGERVHDSENLALKEATVEWLKPSEQDNSPIHLDLVNTEVWLDSLSKKYGMPVTLGDIPPEEFTEIAQAYGGIWLMGIWQDGPEPLEVSKFWGPREYTDVIPDLDPEKDVRGSPYAVYDYSPNRRIAPGETAEERWKLFDKMVETAHQYRLKVLVDVVPNHLSSDNPLTLTDPDMFVQGTEEQFKAQPVARTKDEQMRLGNRLFEVKKLEPDGTEKSYYLAHGGAPGFIPWSDTAQIDFSKPKAHEYIRQLQLMLVRHRIDGARYDMVYLTHPEVFNENWGNYQSVDNEYLLARDPETGKLLHDVWKNTLPEVVAEAKSLAREEAIQAAFANGLSSEEADIAGAKAAEHADFYTIAEVYDNDPIKRDNRRRLDSTTADSRDGFEYMYAMDLYHNLHALRNGQMTADNFRNHLNFIMTERKKGNQGSKHYHDVVFEENHDDGPAIKTLGEKESLAAAALLWNIDDALFMMTDGQMIGRDVKLPVQVRRGPTGEKPNEQIHDFYERNLRSRQSRIFQEGSKRWAGLTQNDRNIFAFRYESPNAQLTHLYESEDRKSEVVTGKTKLYAIELVNFSDRETQCRVPEITPEMEVQVEDIMTGEIIKDPDTERHGGMYFKLAPWKAQRVIYTSKAA